MKWLRHILLSISVAVILLLLYFRRKIELAFASLFSQAWNVSADKYPTSFSNIDKLFIYSYKWAFTGFFTFFFILANICFVWSLFPKRIVFVTQLKVYSLVVLLIVFFSILSISTGNYQVGFGVVYFIKKALQTPYLSLFFILYYWKINPPKDYYPL